MIISQQYVKIKDIFTNSCITMNFDTFTALSPEQLQRKCQAFRACYIEARSRSQYSLGVLEMIISQQYVKVNDIFTNYCITMNFDTFTTLSPEQLQRKCQAFRKS